MKHAIGQAAFEYILTASVIGIMILPAAYFFYSYSSSSADQIDKAQLDRLGRDIINTAEKVYYQGPPSRTQLEVRMPKSVKNLSIIGDWGTGAQMLLITATSGNSLTDFPYPSRVNINGTFNNSFYELSISPGIKQINIEAYELPSSSGGQTTSFVYINFGGRCPRSATYDFNGDGHVLADDRNFIGDCNNNAPGRPKVRPEKTWRPGWFYNIGCGVKFYAVCMNADYDGDCDVDNDDVAQFCTHSEIPCVV